MYSLIDSCMCPDLGLNPQSWCIGTTLLTKLPSQGLPIFLFLKRFYLFIFRERRREGEKHGCVRETSTAHPTTGNLARSQGVCPDRESNQGLFSSQASVQSTKPHQPGPSYLFKQCFMPPGSNPPNALIFIINKFETAGKRKQR